MAAWPCLQSLSTRVTIAEFGRMSKFARRGGLTLRAKRPKTARKVLSPQDSFYARWRVQSGLVMVLCEDTQSPPERLLQAIWHHQRLLRDQLKTSDGQPVRILHPGFRNMEGGPDFRGALVQLGDATTRQGDIEVDLRPSGWHAHGHDTNPAFGKVVLHVVWENERPLAGAPPLVCIRQCLDSPLGELSVWLGTDSAAGFPETLRGKCCATLKGLDQAHLEQLLNQAAAVRLRAKAGLFQARARQVGWEQSLWEGLFRALGYKHNIWPMQHLGELRPRWLVPGEPPLNLQARLLGLSGLLPGELPGRRGDNDEFVRGLWDLWWREQDAFSDVVLPPKAWRLHGLRPANHPHRRLALAAGWSIGEPLPARLQDWGASACKLKEMGHTLMDALQVQTDEFWARHWTLSSKAFKTPKPLLGASRVSDLAMNVVIPWLWTRSMEGKNESLRRSLEERYFTWPAAADNSLLRLARERLLGGATSRFFTRAAAQQGLLQLVRDFCDQSNSVCHNCKLPELVKEWRANCLCQS